MAPVGPRLQGMGWAFAQAAAEVAWGLLGMLLLYQVLLTAKGRAAASAATAAYRVSARTMARELVDVCGVEATPSQIDEFGIIPQPRCDRAVAKGSGGREEAEAGVPAPP